MGARPAMEAVGRGGDHGRPRQPGAVVPWPTEAEEGGRRPARERPGVEAATVAGRGGGRAKRVQHCILAGPAWSDRACAVLGSARRSTGQHDMTLLVSRAGRTGSNRLVPCGP